MPWGTAEDPVVLPMTSFTPTTKPLWSATDSRRLPLPRKVSLRAPSTKRLHMVITTITITKPLAQATSTNQWQQPHSQAVTGQLSQLGNHLPWCPEFSKDGGKKYYGALSALPAFRHWSECFVVSRINRYPIGHTVSHSTRPSPSYRRSAELLSSFPSLRRCRSSNGIGIGNLGHYKTSVCLTRLVVVHGAV